MQSLVAPAATSRPPNIAQSLPADRRRGAVRPRGRSLRLLPLVVLAAFATTACDTASTLDTDQPATVIPSGLPIPVGADASDIATGVDQGLAFVSFSSPLSPAEAAAAYERQLSDAGFQSTGVGGGWTGYESSQLALELQVAPVGPPTRITVRYDHQNPYNPPGQAKLRASGSPRTADKPDPPSNANRPSTPPGQAGTGATGGNGGSGGNGTGSTGPIGNTKATSAPSAAPSASAKPNASKGQP